MKASDVVAALFDASERRDLEGCLDLFADDGVWHPVPLEAGKGREGIRKLIAPMMEMMREVEVIVLRQVEVGDIVMQERVDRFKIGDEWREIPVAGVFEIKDGKIQIWRDYFCLKTFEQLLAPSA